MADRSTSTPKKGRLTSSATPILHCVTPVSESASAIEASAGSPRPLSRSKFVEQMTLLADTIDLQIETFLKL